MISKSNQSKILLLIETRKKKSVDLLRKDNIPIRIINECVISYSKWKWVFYRPISSLYTRNCIIEFHSSKSMFCTFSCSMQFTKALHTNLSNISASIKCVKSHIIINVATTKKIHCKSFVILRLLYVYKKKTKNIFIHEIVL